MMNSKAKNFTIVEIGNDTTKMLAGSFLGNSPYVFCVKEVPSRDVMSNGYIKKSSTERVTEAIKEVLDIEDEGIANKSSLKNVYVVLPPNGMSVSSRVQACAVMARSNRAGRVDQEDISQLFLNIKTHLRQEHPDYSIVEILPQLYRYDQRTSKTAPLNEVTEQIEIVAHVQTIPQDLNHSHTNVFEAAEISVQGYGLSPQGASRLIELERKDLETYFILDLGGGSSFVSLIGENTLFNSMPIEEGSNSLTETIANEFAITYEEAERIKRVYGYSKRKTEFMPPIATNALNRSFRQEDLNEIIERWFRNFNLKLKTCIEEVIAPHTRKFGEKLVEQLAHSPVFLIGGGSNLLGISELLRDGLGERQSIVFTPSVAGARDPKYVNLLGLLVAKCTSEVPEQNKDTGILTRSEN